MVNDKKKKGANDARGKLFAKLIRGIEVAAKNGGADPNNNAALYQAISKAKSNSVPNSNIDNALKEFLVIHQLNHLMRLHMKVMDQMVLQY